MRWSAHRCRRASSRTGTPSPSRNSSGDPVTRNVTWDRGVSLPEHAIWFDPEVTRALAVVTHAHTDHSRRHRETYLTPETLALTAPNRRPRAARLLGFGDEARVAGGVLRLVPAGHMLGSA